MSFRRCTSLLFALLIASPLAAACTLQPSDSGVVRMDSGDERTLTWNTVPGASSYLVETVIDGLNEPSGPDFTFGGAYTESRNVEGRSMTSFLVRHAVTYKMRFRYVVSALARENAAWVPCKAEVLYVVEPDAALASISSRRIVPIAGKAPGMNNANYSTALIVHGTRWPSHVADPEDPKFYQGRIVFRPLGTTASDSDPSIEYAFGGSETVVYDDIMATLGATGIGTLEIIPKNAGWPTPQADAIVENRMQDGRRTSARIPAVWGRDLLDVNDMVTVAIRNVTDARLSIGVRSFAGPMHLIVQHLKSDGEVVATENRIVNGDVTSLFALRDLFPGAFAAGDRITVRYNAIDVRGPEGRRFPSAKGVVVFVTETGNDFNSPSLVYRESMEDSRYANGFDRWLVY